MSTSASTASPAIPRRSPLDESPEDEAEDGVAEGLLGEDAFAPERRQVSLGAPRMLAVDEQGERVEGDVLGQREPEGERTRRQPAPPADALDPEAEERAVRA